MATLDPLPKEFWSMRQLITFVSNENRLSLKTMVLCLTRLEIDPIVIGNDILINIAVHLTERKFILRLIDDLIRYPDPSNVPVLHEATDISRALMQQTVNNTKFNAEFEIFQIRTNSTWSKYCDIILGFINDDFGDVESNGNIIIKRDSFYKKQMNFSINGEIKSIEFWTCNDFPFHMTLHFLSRVLCNNKTPLKIIGCFINTDLRYDDMQECFRNNNYMFKWGNITYANALVYATNPIL